MAANGISTLATKQLRQVAKLDLAQAKRKGQTITEGGGTWSTNGVDDDTKNYYRSNNTYDITTLPNVYDGNVPANPDANPNPDGLVPKRPWVAVSSIAAPESIEQSVDGGTFADLQVWYDSADTSTIQPSANDEGAITQWTDKSVFAHNANPTGGNEKPTYENTDPLNTYGYIEFDGTQGLSINPIAWAQNLTGFTAFIVARPTVEANGTTLMTTDTGDFNLAHNGSTWTVGMNTGTATPTAGNEANSLNSWGIYTLVYDAANPMTFRLNKTDVPLGTYTPPATSSASNQYLYIAHDETATAFTGGIAEIIFFTKALGATEYANVENYLSNKWGL